MTALLLIALFLSSRAACFLWLGLLLMEKDREGDFGARFLARSRVWIRHRRCTQQEDWILESILQREKAREGGKVHEISVAAHGGYLLLVVLRSKTKDATSSMMARAVMRRRRLLLVG